MKQLPGVFDHFLRNEAIITSFVYRNYSTLKEPKKIAIFVVKLLNNARVRTLTEKTVQVSRKPMLIMYFSDEILTFDWLRRVVFLLKNGISKTYISTTFWTYVMLSCKRTDKDAS